MDQTAKANPYPMLEMASAGGMRHTAYYVAGDLSNSGFKGGYQQWMVGLGGKATYFKAASYLMHDERFSQARDFFHQRRAMHRLTIDVIPVIPHIAHEWLASIDDRIGTAVILYDITGG